VEDLQETGVVGTDFKQTVSVEDASTDAGAFVEIGGSCRCGCDGCRCGQRCGLGCGKRRWLWCGWLIWLRAWAMGAAAEQAVVTVLGLERLGSEREEQCGGG